MESCKFLKYFSLKVFSNIIFKAHTNPILITFCCLLSYKDLSDHLLAYGKENKKKQSKTIIRFINGLDYSYKRRLYLIKEFGNRKYKKQIINKWHLIAFLMKNPILLMFRKNNFKFRKINDEVIISLNDDFRYLNATESQDKISRI
jgi:hypothetical protein